MNGKQIIILLFLLIAYSGITSADMFIYGDVFATGTISRGGKIILKKSTIDGEGPEATIEITDDGLELSDIKIKKSAKVDIWKTNLREELNKENPDMKKVAKMLARGILWLYKESLEE